MPFLIEHITEVVFSILVLLFLCNGALIALAIARRQRRERFFQRIDELRRLYNPVISDLKAGRLDYAQGLAALRGITGTDREYIWEQLCLATTPTPAQIPNLRRLCEDLGLVKVWQRQVSGQFDVATLRDAMARPEGVFQLLARLRFILRAKSAENLGIIRHQPSWPLLLKALTDPHVDVQNAALRSLAAIGDPESFLGLVQRLHDVVLKPGTRLSLRAVKAVLVTFPLAQAPALLPSLQHANRRIRFFATDIIRDMVDRQAALDQDFTLDLKVFPEELRELFLTQLGFDENPDVRARAAPILARIPDPRSAPLLLTLLGDPEWFVRLHVVRTLAQPKFQPQVVEIARRLTDANWMVREAAAQTLLTFGQLGVNQLFQDFLSSPDRYSREQIADTMQRRGLVPNLIDQYLESRDGKEKQVIEQLAQMGKTSYLLALLASTPDKELRRKFLLDFGHYSEANIRKWVINLATREPDPELRALARAALQRA